MRNQRRLSALVNRMFIRTSTAVIFWNDNLIQINFRFPYKNWLCCPNTIKKKSTYQFGRWRDKRRKFRRSCTFWRFFCRSDAQNSNVRARLNKWACVVAALQRKLGVPPKCEGFGDVSTFESPRKETIT